MNANTHRGLDAEESTLLLSSAGNSDFEYVLKGGIVLTMDEQLGNFKQANVLIKGKKIIQIGSYIEVGEQVQVIDASGCIVMPGFIDTHHHQYQTPFRSFLSDALLNNDGKPDNQFNYLDIMHLKLTPLYRPEDVYISILISSLNQLDKGVTTVVDTSQVGNTEAHIDAIVNGLKDGQRRAVMSFSQGQGSNVPWPQDIHRLKNTYFNDSESLLTLAMGSEFWGADYRQAWKIARDLGLRNVTHVVGWLNNSKDILKAAIHENLLGADNLLIHCTALDDQTWEGIAKAGAHVTIASPIELSMRHGTPPLIQALKYGVQTSLSTDVESVFSADFFDQMRSAFTLQRGQANQLLLDGISDTISLLKPIDVLRLATIEGARAIGLDQKTGSLAPGKEADILLLRVDDLNIMPVNNVPGALVTLMGQSNIDTVIVAGMIKKWKGTLLQVDQILLNQKIADSRDYLVEKAGLENKLF